jgi:hypothetical protein
MCSGNPWVWTLFGNQNGSQHPYFLFFIFFIGDPYNTDGRVVASVGGLCFGLFARVRLGIE